MKFCLLINLSLIFSRWFLWSSGHPNLRLSLPRIEDAATTDDHVTEVPAIALPAGSQPYDGLHVSAIKLSQLMFVQTAWKVSTTLRLRSAWTSSSREPKFSPLEGMPTSGFYCTAAVRSIIFPWPHPLHIHSVKTPRQPSLLGEFGIYSLEINHGQIILSSCQ